VLCEVEWSDDPRLDKAKEMIINLKTRDFYKYVGEKVIPVSHVPILKNLSEKDVVNCQSTESGVSITVNDIVLRKFGVNYAFGDKNPFEKVKFYLPPNDKSRSNFPNFNSFSIRMFLQGFTICN
jgi:hypothetical protein